MERTEKAILDGLTLDDLSENHREIAEVIGMDGLKLLSDTFGELPYTFQNTRNL